MTDQLYYICDLRDEWLHKPYVSFWRPEDAGYCYPLSWAGKYPIGRIACQVDYYFNRNTRSFVRFPILCSSAEKFATNPKPGTIDGDAGPVIWMNKTMRATLRAAMLPLAAVGSVGVTDGQD